jgi:hypothetical protein
MGDSNTGSGQYFNATYDTTRATLGQIKHDYSIVLPSQEPLDLISMVANYVGSTSRLCQFLIDNGHVPAGVARIIMVPCGWAGTGLNPGGNSAWNVAGTRYALDGGGGIPVGNGLYGMINHAKSAYPNNKIWFFNWIEGANDGSWTAAAWAAAFAALFSEVRGIYPDAVSAPILGTPYPPDRVNPQMGYEVNLQSYAQYQSAVTAVSGGYYIDPTTPTILHSYLDNSFVHYNAASHRGGQYNIDTTPYLWSAGTTYNNPGLYLGQKCVVASDNFIYQCIGSGNIGNNPAGNAYPSLWAQQWDTSATVADTVCLAYRQYQALLSAGF